jgi:hypothetical protein
VDEAIQAPDAEATPDRIAGAVRTLLREPAEDELQLLTAIAEPFLEEGVWPIFDHVESELDKVELDAESLTESLPSWSRRYGLVWPGPGSLRRPEDDITLTVAGLAVAGRSDPRALEVVESYLAALRFFAERFRHAPSGPRTVRRVEVEAGQLPESPVRLLQLNSLFDHEPVGWRQGSSIPQSNDPWEWSVGVGREIRRYGDVGPVEDYLGRLAEWLMPPPVDPPPLHPSSMSLPEAIDFLDTVWRLAFGSHLFDLPGAAKTAELSLPCASRDELGSRLSAVANVLTRLSPDRAEPSERGLATLEKFLASQLPDGSRSRVGEAIATLRRINDLRVDSEHFGSRDVRRASEALGLSFPLSAPDQAWEQIRLVATHAFNAIREEIQASQPDS